MRLFIVAVTLVTTLGVAFAQSAPPPDGTQQVLNQLHQVGCNAEEQVSANTIAKLQKENADLKEQLKKLDPPPKSGATKH